MEAKERVEAFLIMYADIVEEEKVHIKKGVLKEYPIVWRFFVEPHDKKDPDEVKRI